MLCSESMRHTAPPWSLQKKKPLFQKEVAHRRKMAVSGWLLRLGNEGNASHPISWHFIRNLSGRDVIVALHWFTKIWDPDWGDHTGTTNFPKMIIRKISRKIQAVFHQSLSNRILRKARMARSWCQSLLGLPGRFSSFGSAYVDSGCPWILVTSWPVGRV